MSVSAGQGRTPMFWYKFQFMVQQFKWILLLNGLLVEVLFAPIRGGSLGICSVSCILYGMVRKHYSTAII